MDVHFGQCELEGLFAAESFLEGGGVELDVAADLGDVEGDGADAGGEGLVLVAVGVAFAGGDAFVGLGLKGLMAFDAHGFINEESDAFGEAGGALKRSGVAGRCSRDQDRVGGSF